jgi:hypothetical protein
MSLNVYLTVTKPTQVFESNITHNLGAMACHADLYKALWRPEEMGIEYAHQLISPLHFGLKKLKEAPELFKVFNPENGWGTYEGLVKFVEKYLEACIANPDAEVRACR